MQGIDRNTGEPMWYRDVTGEDGIVRRETTKDYSSATEYLCAHLLQNFTEDSELRSHSMVLTSQYSSHTSSADSLTTLVMHSHSTPWYQARREYSQGCSYKLMDSFK